MSISPLEGIRVIVFGSGVAIPDFGKIVGEFGADVIKIESNDNLDFMRTIGSNINSSPGFNETNRNFRSFGVDLTTEKGKKLVGTLIETADIIAENFRGGVLKSLGFDYDSVRKHKPDIIYISSQGFGSGGPNSDYRAYGPMLAAGSGVLSLWAHPDDEFPAGGNFPHPDHVASKQAVLAVLAALDYKRRTGKGQLIDMSQIEAAASLIGESYLDYTVNKRVPTPIGNRSPYAAPHNLYRCKGHDQWCAITIFTNEEWENFCLAIGNPEWAKDAKFADTLGRIKNVDELDKHIEAWTTQYDPEVVMGTLQAVGVAAGIVQRAVDTISDPQLKWLNSIVEVDHPVAGKRLYPNMPWRMSDISCCKSTPAPLLGEHTPEICRDILKLSDTEIEKLKDGKIIQVPSIEK